MAFVAYPTIAKADSLIESAATNITAYNISQENCEAYQENYLSAEQWATDYAAKIEELQCIVSELDSLGGYVDGDYSVDYDSLTYISDVQAKIDELAAMRDAANQKKKEAEEAAARARTISYSNRGNSSSSGAYYGGNTGGLTRQSGVNYYNGYRETYYNLNMNGVVSNAQNMGISGNYWVREDGVKMYGDYVIVASSDHSKGTVVDTSLGTGIVLDYCPGSGIHDIATAW